MIRSKFYKKVRKEIFHLIYYFRFKVSTSSHSTKFEEVPLKRPRVKSIFDAILPERTSCAYKIVDFGQFTHEASREDLFSHCEA